MQRILAIIERDLRKFQRSPFLMFAALVLPLTQLVILGYAFGGNIRNLKVGVVDQDHGMAAIALREMMGAVEANARTFETVNYSDLNHAVTDLRNARLSAVVNIPPHFTRDVLAQADPQVGLIVDNTDNFVANALEGAFTNLVADYYKNGIDPRMQPTLTLQTVEVYGYTPYIKFLLPGAIALAIFITAMIGGGIIFIDDKARGLHEGYLVTPITRLELIVVFALTSVALVSMMFLIMVRMEDPLLPRALFGVLNTLLWFPSGAIYPTAAFPGWMRAIAIVDPFTYAVNALQSLILKNTGFAAIWPDLVVLLAFSAVTMGAATLLFKRTL